MHYWKSAFKKLQRQPVCFKSSLSSDNESASHSMGPFYIHSVTTEAARLQWRSWWLAHVGLNIFIKTTANIEEAGCATLTCFMEPLLAAFITMCICLLHALTSKYSTLYKHYIIGYILYIWANQGHFLMSCHEIKLFVSKQQMKWIHRRNHLVHIWCAR